MSNDDSLKMNNEYGVDQVDSLEQLEAIRKRPGMYIGSTSQSGIDQLVLEVIDNNIDEYVAGHGKNIWLKIFKDGSVESRDEARGIPVGPHHKWKNKDGSPMDTLTGILTIVHAGGKFGGDSGYKCFIDGCVVNTPTEKINIEKIKQGDIIINGHNQHDEVINAFSYDYDGLVNKVVLENEKEFAAIDGHYILIKRDDNLYWEIIENIKVDDFLIELEEDDDIEELKRIIPKYNFTKY